MLVGVPAGERLAVRTINPLIRAMIRRALAIDEGGVARSTERLEAAYAEVESMLADGRPFLVGNRFTAADLTFAALAAPLVFPPQGAFRMPELAELPADVREVIERWRARPASEFALRIYAAHRPAAAAAA